MCGNHQEKLTFAYLFGFVDTYVIGFDYDLRSTSITAPDRIQIAGAAEVFRFGRY